PECARRSSPRGAPRPGRGHRRREVLEVGMGRCGVENDAATSTVEYARPTGPLSLTVGETKVVDRRDTVRPRRATDLAEDIGSAHLLPLVVMTPCEGSEVGR